MSNEFKWARSHKQKAYRPTGYSDLALYRVKLTERELPPRKEMMDSQGQPISLGAGVDPEGEARMIQIVMIYVVLVLLASHLPGGW